MYPILGRLGIDALVWRITHLHKGECFKALTPENPVLAARAR
jgi:hypothetical protein